MSRKVFLSLVALIAMAIGILALLAPGALLESKGVPANAAASVWVREVGVALVAIATIAFLVRAHPDSPTMRAFLAGNALLQLGLLPIEIAAFENGVLTRISGIVPNSVLHVVLACAFVFYALRIKPAVPATR